MQAQRRWSCTPYQPLLALTNIELVLPIIGAPDALAERPTAMMVQALADTSRPRTAQKEWIIAAIAGKNKVGGSVWPGRLQAKAFLGYDTQDIQ